MVHYLTDLGNSCRNAIQQIFHIEIQPELIQFNQTKPEFEGEFTLVVFPLVKLIGKSPEFIGGELGAWLVNNDDTVSNYNVVKGFLNIILSSDFWLKVLETIDSDVNFGRFPSTGKRVMVEFSSPNTNKPLHLGHIRNILLGWSCSRILEANGYEVIKTQVINDRGIAICKSMLAWQKFGENKTPDSTGIKSDHFVGDYYVLFEKKFQEEYSEWQNSMNAVSIFNDQKKTDQSEQDFFKAFKNTYFNQYSKLGAEARKMLLEWEAKEENIISLWRKMNGWVYDGFEKTYQMLGVCFDVVYYESDTYLLGKKAVESGLERNVFYKETDGSVWINLEDAGMDKKVVLRSDGTSVYITQDIGTAQQRYADYNINAMVYTVADEQDYHFKVLFEILKRLKEPYAGSLFHLSYGMVDLPTGKMKSREGTVVDADDLIEEVTSEVKQGASERGELSHLSIDQQNDIIRKIALGALKYFIIKVSPRKRMIFDPKESVDMQGQTGPYIQNAHVRINSILRKAGKPDEKIKISRYAMNDPEKMLLRSLSEYPEILREAGQNLDPSAIANYCYALAKQFHRYYHDVRILNAESEDAKIFRLTLCRNVSKVLNSAMDLLGIEMPERM
ncbi:MAG: arginine--tRNA ligase [Saprospiraceae bacterium]|nr:arginine--tRNA ligase [Saprospiraceae bacterium]